MKPECSYSVSNVPWADRNTGMNNNSRSDNLLLIYGEIRLKHKKIPVENGIFRRLSLSSGSTDGDETLIRWTQRNFEHPVCFSPGFYNFVIRKNSLSAKLNGKRFY